MSSDKSICRDCHQAKAEYFFSDRGIRLKQGRCKECHEKRVAGFRPQQQPTGRTQRQREKTK